MHNFAIYGIRSAQHGCEVSPFFIKRSIIVAIIRFVLEFVFLLIILYLFGELYMGRIHFSREITAIIYFVVIMGGLEGAFFTFFFFCFCFYVCMYLVTVGHIYLSYLSHSLSWVSTVFRLCA